MSNPIKTAVVGFGAAGKFMHSPFIKTQPGHFDVVAVLERHRNESAALFPAARIVRNLEELLQIDELELVVITTPNDTHFPYSKAAMLAGKHVVVDKPFTITSGDALALIDVASQTGKMLSVFQNRRYVTDFITIAEILKKKKYAGHGSQLRGALSSLSPRSKTKCMAGRTRPWFRHFIRPGCAHH